MIDDDELRSLYSSETEACLRRLEEGLLQLKITPDDASILKGAFREAHNLKGASRMLGVGNVEAVAHHFEDVLGTAKRGETALTQDVVRRLYEALEAIHEFVNQAVTGAEPKLHVFEVLGKLNGIIASEPITISETRSRARVPAIRQSDEIGTKRVILLVDDSAMARAMERQILEGGGYEVVTAVDGLDAMKQLGARAIDAVVSDVEMPNMDGLALTVRIRRDTQYRTLPVILLTALSGEAHVQRGMEAGANAYLTKASLDPDNLLDVLRRLI